MIEEPPCTCPGEIAHYACPKHGLKSLPRNEVLVEALTDIRNRILCPAGPAPTLDQIADIASKALGEE